MSGALPAWLHSLPDAGRMRATDAWAIEQRGVPSLLLMERAGEGLAALAAEVAPAGPVAVVVGRGNNGGDGLVAARLLREAGREVRVLAAAPLEGLRGDPAANLARLPGDPPAPFSAGALRGAGVIVDALLGTGASGPLREDARAVVQAMDAAPAPVVAADVPSGVDASTGEVADVAVRCAATATFHLAKPGLWIAPGKAHAGRVREVAIGMPPGAPVEAEIGLIGDAALDLVPRRDAAGTKFSSGAVLVAGGSRGLTGAVCLAALGAMRAGAGYVTVGVPEALEAIFEVKLTEAMSVGLPAEGGAAVVLERAERVDALVLGSGLGREERALAFAREVAAGARLPLVLDADGLNAHAGALEALAARPGPTVLTPHAGELGRLLGVRSGEVAARRLHHVREAARRAQAVVALKGDDTLVAEPGGRVAVSPGGAPGLATAGTGDVLAGVVGALLAKGLHPWPAACAAVLAHVRAGQRAATAAGGADGLIAGDVATALPAAFARA